MAPGKDLSLALRPAKQKRTIALLLVFVLAVASLLFSSFTQSQKAQAGTATTDGYLSFQVVASPNPATAGQTVTWTFTIKNTDTVSWYWSYPGYTSAKISGLPSGCSLSQPSTTKGWTSNTSGDYHILPGATATLSCTTTAPAATTTTTATLSGMMYQSGSYLYTYNSLAATEKLTINTAGPDLTVTKTADKASAVVGDTVTYTIVVKNSGTTTSSTYTLNDTVPSNFNTVAAAGCTVATNAVTCADQPALAAGASKTFTITAKAATVGSTSNTAALANTTGETSATNNTSSPATVTITSASTGETGGPGGTVESNDSGRARFSVTKTANKYTLPYGGGSITYTYTIKNLNPASLKSYEQDAGYYYSYDYWPYSVFFTSVTDDKCPDMSYVSGLDRATTGEYAIRPGETATFTCTMGVTATTTNTVTAKFYDSKKVALTAATTAKVVVGSAATGVADCDTLWYTSDHPSGYNQDGSIGRITPTKPPTYTENALVQGSTSYYVGSAAVAVDPLNPQMIYYVPRTSSSGTATYYGLRTYNSATGEDKPTSLTNVASSPVRLGFDGTGTMWTIDSAGKIYSWKPGDTTATLRGSLTLDDGKSMSNLLSGDLAFDGLGNMWLIVSDSNGVAYLYTISAAELAGTDGAKANSVGSMGSGWFYGLAFDSKGNLYAAGGPANSDNADLYLVNKATGTTEIYGPIGYATGDLSSCALPKPELRVNKSVDPQTGVVPGGTVTYKITVENIGTLDATGATLQDYIPAGTTYVAGTTKLNGQLVADVNATGNNAFPYTVAREISSWNPTTNKQDLSGTIAQGRSAVITFQVKVPTTYTATTVCNQGLISFVGSESTGIKTDDSSVPGSDNSTCTNVLKPAIGVDKKLYKTDQTGAIAKDADGNPTLLSVVNPGETVTYFYYVGTDPNQLKDGPPEVAKTGLTVGTETLKNVALIDDKCSSVKPVLASGSTTINAGDLNSDGLLQPSETWQYTCTTTIQAGALDATGALKNTATATGAGNTSNTAVSDKDTWTVKAPKFAVKKQAAAANGTWADTGTKVQLNDQGDATLTYQVTVTNTGTIAAKAPAITDTFTAPAGLTVTSVSLNGTAITANADGTYTIPAGTTDLAPNASTSYTVTVVVHAADQSKLDATTIGTCNTTNDGTPGTGGFNRISYTADSDGTANNDACVPIEVGTKSVTIAKKGVNCDTNTPVCDLTGANFAIYDKDPSTAGATPISGGITADTITNGMTGTSFTAKNLIIGKTYWIVETQSPDKFNLLADPIKFTVNADGIVLDQATYPQGTTVTATAFAITVKDTPMATLPKAGGPGHKPYAAAGFILIAAGLVLVRRPELLQKVARSK